jgi:uncharacterized protein
LNSPRATHTWYRWQRDTDSLLLDLALQPGAKRCEWIGLHGNALKLRIQAPPIEGRANRALIEFLSKEFATAKSNITVIRGESSRSKTVRIDAPQTLPKAWSALDLAIDWQP